MAHTIRGKAPERLDSDEGMMNVLVMPG